MFAMSEEHLKRVRSLCFAFPGVAGKAIARRTNVFCQQESLHDVRE